ncbi:hypothetical protein J4H40_03210 [Vibrio alginolyticus]|jgi:uncharacterized membrane protein|uniref:hypothetical protein n=1 Tax=Vibrio TaxID=662 RepID=UPI001BD6B147|nr:MULTISPECIES: hypothetical protein [Vibrio]MBT0028428.1 hypothetical protein [Vibrio alginolyticus]MDW1699417.1 hypothetical protein [Vibrio sp. Vb2657]
MKKWLYENCSVIFWLTFITYALTLYFASYVGVYLTYVAVPTIVITGFIAYLTRPKEEQNNK